MLRLRRLSIRMEHSSRSAIPAPTEQGHPVSKGDIVGSYSPPGFPELAYGFIYHNGAFVPFDQPNCNGTVPQAINNHGVIVGEACNGAFIATPQTEGKPSR